jgi:cob(I)alamin adenosyltransferase
MDEKIKSRIHDIMYDYFEKNDLIPKNQIKKQEFKKLEEHVKYVLETHDQYKEEIPDLKIKILEILAEEIF